MLVELGMLAILTSSCDVTKAALGGCGTSCSQLQPVPGSFSICGTQTTPGSSTVGSTPRPKPMRWCSYYANGTIDIPTLTVITSWVEVGSRLCIGDPVPEPIVYKSIGEQLNDIFTAQLAAPVAWRTGVDVPEPFEMVSFFVDSKTTMVPGSLFGRAATIRFTPVSVNWVFSDGQRISGGAVAKGFEEPGQVWGYANVSFQVDYRYDQGWQSGASWSLQSNRVSLKVVDPPRRALLVP